MATSQALTAMPAAFRFLDLPQELKDKVYIQYFLTTDILPHEIGECWASYDCNLHSQPWANILATSRQVRWEASAMPRRH